MIKCLSSKIGRHLFFIEEGEELYMRDKQYRKKQEDKKSYKTFYAEQKRNKFRDPQKGARSSNKLKKNDIDDMIEEEQDEELDQLNIEDEK